MLHVDQRPAADDRDEAAELVDLLTHIVLVQLDPLVVDPSMIVYLENHFNIATMATLASSRSTPIRHWRPNCLIGGSSHPPLVAVAPLRYQVLVGDLVLRGA